MADGIEADDVDWQAVAGPSGYYRPEVVGPALHALATATGAARAARAAAALAGGGIVHDHSGAVWPAAAFAAPILLDILEHGHPAARTAAGDLLCDSLVFLPRKGYSRVRTAVAAALPVCCAIAYHVHLRQPARTDLLAEADRHWLFRVDEAEADADGTGGTAFGALHGLLPSGRHDAECHTPTGCAPVVVTITEPPVSRADPTALLHLRSTGPLRVPTGAVVTSAEHD
jgi:hypothetical protein